MCHIFLQIDRSRGEKGGFGPLQSMGSGRIESAFSEMSISSSGSGFGSGSGLGVTTDFDSFSTKAKGLCLFVCLNCVFLSHILVMLVLGYMILNFLLSYICLGGLIYLH